MLYTRMSTWNITAVTYSNFSLVCQNQSSSCPLQIFLNGIFSTNFILVIIQVCRGKTCLISYYSVWNCDVIFVLVKFKYIWVERNNMEISLLGAYISPEWKFRFVVINLIRPSHFSHPICEVYWAEEPWITNYFWNKTSEFTLF